MEEELEVGEEGGEDRASGEKISSEWGGSKPAFLRQRQALLPGGLDFVHEATGLFLKFKGNSVVRFAFRETLYYFNMENGLEGARLQTRRWGTHVTAWDLGGGDRSATWAGQ